MSAKEAPRISWLVEPKFDQDGVQSTAGLDQFSREHGDPCPVSPPVGLSVDQGDELHTAIRNILIKERNLFRAMTEAEEFESEEEANDFITEDDIFPPGNEPWADIHDFPAEGPGGVANGSSLASEAVKGEPARQDAAPPAASSASGRVSADSSRVDAPAQPEQMPTRGDAGERSGMVDRGPARQSSLR